MCKGFIAVATVLLSLTGLLSTAALGGSTRELTVVYTGNTRGEVYPHHG